MDIINWLASGNSFKSAMEESRENAIGILMFTKNALFMSKDNANPGFNILYTETSDVVTALLSAMGIKEGKGSTKSAHTTQVELAYSKMSERLNHFDDGIRPVFGKNSFEYNTIWGANRNRFYDGSYEEREIAVLGLSEVMDDYPALAAVTAEVLVYYNDLLDARNAQQGVISDFKSDGVDVSGIINDGILQMDRNLGWLKFYFAKLPDAQANVNTHFDLTRIINHSNNKVYTWHLPIGGYVKVCRHQFVPTDKVKITVDGTEDVFFYLAPVGLAPVMPAQPYRAVAGAVVEVLASTVFPSFTNKQVVAQNSSGVTASHFIFEIIQAK